MADVRRGSWQLWRRTRPFWGGLLLALAGLELIAIPLSGVLSHGAIKLVIYIGIGGVFGVLLGVLLIACGVLVCVNPVHRVFYGLAGVLLGILSFPASNLGGFFIGMLLAIIGGSIAFAWSPLQRPPAAAGEEDDEDEPAEEPAGDPGRDPAYGPGEDPAAEFGGTLAGQLGGARATGFSRSSAGRHGEGSAGRFGAGTAGKPAARLDPGPGRRARILAVAALPVILLTGLLSASAARAAPAAPAQPGGNCILLILCFPNPSPSPSPNPSPSKGSGPGPSPSPSGSGSATGQPPPGSSPAAAGHPRSRRPARRAAAGRGLVAATATSVITAGSATLDGLAYQGAANVPVAGGGTVRMMKFTATSLTLTGDVTASVTQNRVTTVTTSPTLGFGGSVVLYATRLSGCLGPLCVTLTPDNAVTVLLRLARGVTGELTLTLTHVTTDQPLVTAGSLQAGALKISLG